VDRASIADLLAERKAELGLDFVIALDPEGRVVARTDRPASADERLSGDPLVAKAMHDLVPATGFWRSADHVHQAAVIPIALGTELVGFLATGLAVDDGLAAEMSRVGGTDVLFLVGTGDGPVERIASSLDLPHADRVLREITARRGLLEPVLREGKEVAHFDVQADGDSLAGRIDPLRDAAGRPVGAIVALASSDRQLLAFQSIRRVVVIVGLLAVGVAVGLSFLVARRTLGPVRELARAASAAAQGDYSRRILVPPDAELGGMARAFNTLLLELRQRGEMEAYVAAIARHLPDTTPAAPIPHAPPRADLASGTRSTEDLTPSAPRSGAPRALQPGEIVNGRYEVLSVVGRGGMGVVYTARDRELREMVALKLLHPGAIGDAGYIERVKTEIKLARRITHPNVLRTYDYGEHDGLPYISMEYVRGLTLRSLLAQSGRLPLAPGLYLARRLCDGLGAAHAAGILHRDIKPENLILEANGNAKLMDFGIAAPFRDDSARGVSGTPPYMAPETFDGKTPDPRGDIYAVGVILFEVFTGRTPFPARSIAELARIKRAPPPSPSESWREIPPDLEAVIVRCLDPDPEKRPQDVPALRADLDRMGQ
jgi:serine/threonine-protein kinase